MAQENSDRENRANEEGRLHKYQEFSSVEALIKDLHNGYSICHWCGIIFYPEAVTDIHCIGANNG